MLSEFDRGWRLLSRYAEEVAQNPQLAERISRQRAELLNFLDREGLSGIPRVTLNQLYRQERDIFYDRRDTHLALVAQEALRTEEGRFIHPNAMSVARSLRKSVEAGDQRIIIDYTDGTLVHQIGTSGDYMRDFGGKETISNLLRHPNFDVTYPNQAWKQTLQGWATTFPEDTTLRDFRYLLVRFNHFLKIPTVEERLQVLRAEYSLS